MLWSVSPPVRQSLPTVPSTNPRLSGGGGPMLAEGERGCRRLDLSVGKWDTNPEKRVSRVVSLWLR